MPVSSTPTLAWVYGTKTTRVQGLTLVHFSAQLEDLRDTSLTSELNLSTFRTHPRINLGHMGEKVSWI